jgi:hypothetical protein
MSDVFNTIAGLFSKGNIGTTLAGANVGLGEIGNLLAGRQQQQQASNLQKQENAIANLTPAQLSQMAISGSKPVDNALIQSLTNTVQGDLASRGLAEAPGIFAAGESQAIAPYIEQNYQASLNAVLQKLGLPLEYANVIKQFMPNQQSMTPALQLLLQQLAKNKTATATAGTPTTGPNLGQLGTPPTFGDTSGGSTDALNALLQGQSA